MSQRLRFLAILGALACAFGGAALGQVFTEFPIPTAASGALGITVGSDGNLWFTEQTASKIGVIRLGGRITEVPLPAGTGPTRIHAGPDGNLWFSESARAFIGRVDVNTGALTEFPLATSTNATRGITSGPDGNLWTTEDPGNRIGHTATGGGTSFPIPTASSGPRGITAGPDGNLWFTEFSGNKIGRVTTAGVITEFPIPTAAAGAFGITSGPGGYLWFQERSVGKIGRITPAGVITEFPIPSGGEGIAGGADGNIWFVEDSGKIGRLAPSGVVTEFPIPSGSGSAPTGIVAGPDGNLWFVESGANKIGRITIGALFSALPVVISSPGALGSFFKTSVQIHNPTDSMFSGRFILHPGGVSGSSADPGGNFSLSPRQTFSDLDTLPTNGLSGVYTADVFATTGPLPVGVFRVYNDAGAAGTTGFNEEQVLLTDALTTGQTAVLLAPIDSAKFRFNIGVRTFSLGASITVTVRDVNGTVTRVVTKSYPAIFFQQVSAADFLGAPLDTNSSIEILVDAGSLIVYGATADNITQDPSLQLAKRAS
jgi:streptogramin lyase